MPCPIARSLEHVGEWWSILILRDALHGMTRFDEFQRSLGIAPNMLTRRLNALVEAGLLERRRYSEHPPRDEYVPTAARARFSSGPDRAAGVGQQAFRAGRRERPARRPRDRRAGRADPRRSRHRAINQRRDTPLHRRALQRATARGGAMRPLRRQARRRNRRRIEAAGARTGPADDHAHHRQGCRTGARRRRQRPAATGVDPRTRALLAAPIVPMLLRMAWPNILGHGRAVGDRADRDLVHLQARHRRAGRRRAGVPRLDADADDLGRRDGRRHFVRHRARPGRRPARRRRRAGACTPSSSMSCSALSS